MAMRSPFLMCALAAVACSGDDTRARGLGPAASGGAAGADGALDASTHDVEMDQGNAAEPEAAAGGAGGALSDGAASSGAPPSPSYGGSASEDAPDAGCSASPTCSTYCRALVDSPDCDHADSDFASCLCECENGRLASCHDELSSMLSCADSKPPLGCHDGIASVKECEKESQAFEVCVARGTGQLCASNAPECRAFCGAVISAECEKGPPTFTNCLCGCESRSVRDCPIEWSAVVACTGEEFEIACGADGAPVVGGACATEWSDLRACQMGDNRP